MSLAFGSESFSSNRLLGRPGHEYFIRIHSGVFLGSLFLGWACIRCTVHRKIGAVLVSGQQQVRGVALDRPIIYRGGSFLWFLEQRLRNLG